MLGAFAALQTSYVWWGLRATTYHSNLLDSKLAVLHHLSKHPEIEGVGDLNVPISYGMLIEGGTAFIDVLLAGLLSAALAEWKRRNHGGREDFLSESIVFTVRQATGVYLLAQGKCFFAFDKLKMVCAQCGISVTENCNLFNSFANYLFLRFKIANFSS